MPRAAHTATGNIHFGTIVMRIYCWRYDFRPYAIWASFSSPSYTPEYSAQIVFMLSTAISHFVKVNKNSWQYRVFSTADLSISLFDGRYNIIISCLILLYMPRSLFISAYTPDAQCRLIWYDYYWQHASRHCRLLTSAARYAPIMADADTYTYSHHERRTNINLFEALRRFHYDLCTLSASASMLGGLCKNY